jgi:hypothetical protein
VPQPDASSSPTSTVKPQVGTVIDLVKQYAKQETLGPLKGAGRWMAFGAAGSFLFGLGIVLLVLGVLRLVQTEFASTFDGGWSWVPYVVALVVCVLAIVIAVSRIKKTTLSKEPR